jgi:hypothetical protein
LQDGNHPSCGHLSWEIMILELILWNHQENMGKMRYKSFRQTHLCWRSLFIFHLDNHLGNFMCICIPSGNQSHGWKIHHPFSNLLRNSNVADQRNEALWSIMKHYQSFFTIIHHYFPWIFWALVANPRLVEEKKAVKFIPAPWANWISKDREIYRRISPLFQLGCFSGNPSETTPRNTWGGHDAVLLGGWKKDSCGSYIA